MTYGELKKFWKTNLMEKMINIFLYENMPKTIPYGVVEMALIRHGSVGFVKTVSHGYIVNETNPTGTGMYSSYGICPCELGANTVIGSIEFTDGINGVLIKNNMLRQSMHAFINRYAAILANLDITIICASKNIRPVGLFLCDNERIKQRISEFFKASEDGLTKAVVVDDNLSSILKQENVNFYPFECKTDIRMLRDVHRNVLKDFYADIGIKTSKEKRERELTGEVNADDSMLLFNISDMKACREQAVDTINRMYGLNVKVKLNPCFEIIDKESGEEK